MANTIQLERIPEIALRINNGSTSAFISVFGLSGSRLAKTEQEKRLIVFVLEKDQSAVGIGTVGFDIGNMPWDYDNIGEINEWLILYIDVFPSAGFIIRY
jgi:hypothetical protein